MPFHRLTSEEITGQYEDHIFWYVYDEVQAKYVANRNDDGMQPLLYAFAERSDAEQWQDIGTRTPVLQDYERGGLTVRSGTWRQIDKMVAESLGEDAWIGINHEQSLRIFEEYRQFLHERPPEILPGKE